MTPSRIRVHIDRVVFDGVDPGDARAVANAVELAVARALSGNEVDWVGGARARADVALPPGPALPEAVGNAIGSAVRGRR